MAQEVNITSLWSHVPSPDQTKTVKMSASDLTIVWGSDNRFWKWTTEDIDGQSNDVAELLNVCWLQISGSYPVQNLIEGTDYEVKFIVKLKDRARIYSPVSLMLALPDGNKQEYREYLMKKPKEQLLGINVGEFKASKVPSGDIRFSMLSTYPAWKRGLVVFGALIVPKI